MQLLKTIIISSACIALLSSPAEAQTKYTLKKAQVAQVSGKLCGLIKNKWSPVKKSGKAYVADPKGKGRCSKLLAPTALRKSGLSNIPSAAGLIRSRSAIASVLSSSGTPPLVKDIPNSPVKNLFWGPGVIDAINSGTPNQQQCREFFFGSADGSSAGLLGCYAIQGVGYSFQSILEGGGSTCYMKSVSKQAFIDSEAIRVVDGALPNNDITQLFSSPTGSTDRLLKVEISGQGGGGGQTGFIKVDSTAKLGKAGNQYAYTVWFCRDGETTPTGSERATISLSGTFKYQGTNIQPQSSFQNVITAQLTGSGSNITFDVNQNRTATSQGEFGGGGGFKSHVTVTPQNKILTKVYDTYGGQHARKNYSIARFSGSGLSTFRVVEASMKEVFNDAPIGEVGFEYREAEVGSYVSAPDNSLIDDLAQGDISSDPFYQSGASVNPDLSELACDAVADVTLAMDFSKPDLGQVALTCEGERLEHMDFCRSDPEVASAEANYQANCFNH